MTTGTNRQQSRLLPYLLAVLVVLLAYVVYTRVLQGSSPPAAVTIGSPEAASPPAAPTPAATPTTAAQPSPSPTPAAAPVAPARPAGRANPFAALVTERVATPQQVAAPPPPPPVPPPFFPGRPGAEGLQEAEGRASGIRLAGILVKGGETLAIVQVGQATHIVAEGDVVEQFRVVRIEPERVILRSGTQELSLDLGGEQK